ncbi:PREDICTED: GPI-anchored protein LORELEI [Tarenaya hassleriana]|uniref:GPI-anchored protein LORELEI n=1 Tax=Tarenaya hassleriana TaxID=28532 RepID=UPI00053C1BE3|nr:PREDICTED: GPI-anchored protein LORELEI [Tarenaya hassleriana]
MKRKHTRKKSYNLLKKKGISPHVFPQHFSLLQTLKTDRQKVNKQNNHESAHCDQRERRRRKHKMETSPRCLVSFLQILILSGFALSLPLSHDALETHAATSRALLQAKMPCKEDFANKNYTVITSRCKGPNYQAGMCCEAFKEFACPLAEAINDDKTDCATTMFSYINLYGRYPPGIFANMCKEGKDGLDCSNVTTSSSSSSSIPLSSSTLLSLSFLLLFFFFF